MSRRAELIKSDRRNRPQPTSGSFHRWHNFVLGYPDQQVREILALLSVNSGQLVVDPFCGTGTTLIECAKNRIPSIGTDANPFAVFAAQTKCSFHLDPEALERAADRVEERYYGFLATGRSVASDVVYLYLNGSGMLERGWISPKPLWHALALRAAIRQGRKPELRAALTLALVADLPEKIGNMKFGPQIYRGPAKLNVDPIPYFRERIRLMVEDLNSSNDHDKYADAQVYLDDARGCTKLIENKRAIDYIICSPPYPTEHDYTRHTRLELAFTDGISTHACLRQIKKSMIRSHTKGMYKDGDDAPFSALSTGVEALAKQVELAIADKTSGFEKLYPKVVRSYFGGMQRHFASIFPLLKSGGKAAYVVGDQATYMRIPIRTALLLGEVAEHVGFKVREIRLCRRRWATGLSDLLDENILILEKP